MKFMGLHVPTKSQLAVHVWIETESAISGNTVSPCWQIFCAGQSNMDVEVKPMKTDVDVHESMETEELADTFAYALREPQDKIDTFSE